MIYVLIVCSSLGLGCGEGYAFQTIQNCEKEAAHYNDSWLIPGHAYCEERKK